MSDHKCRRCKDTGLVDSVTMSNDPCMRPCPECDAGDEVAEHCELTRARETIARLTAELDAERKAHLSWKADAHRLEAAPAPEGGTRVDLEELERLAKEATPGPWIDRGAVGFARWIVSGGGHQVAMTYGGTTAAGCANADFIAAANPATVLALLAELRESRAELRSLRGGGVR